MVRELPQLCLSLPLVATCQLGELRLHCFEQFGIDDGVVLALIDCRLVNRQPEIGLNGEQVIERLAERYPAADGRASSSPMFTITFR